VNEAYPINMESKEYDEILDKPISSHLLYTGPETKVLVRRFILKPVGA
jgi:hypothetical protein